LPKALKRKMAEMSIYQHFRLPKNQRALEDSKLTSNAQKSSKERRLRHLPSMSVTKV
jgi:hypothetical protein